MLGIVSLVFERRRVVMSFVQRLSRAAIAYRNYDLLVFPAAERFALRDYDVILSFRR